MECNNKCLLCKAAKEYYVNFSRYHGSCGNHPLNNSENCIHCGSIVPILDKSVLCANEEPDAIENKLFLHPELFFSVNQDTLKIPEDNSNQTYHSTEIDLTQKLANNNINEIDDFQSYEITNHSVINESVTNPSFIVELGQNKNDVVDKERNEVQRSYSKYIYSCLIGLALGLFYLKYRKKLNIKNLF